MKNNIFFKSSRSTIFDLFIYSRTDDLSAISSISSIEPLKIVYLHHPFKQTRPILFCYFIYNI